MSFEQGENEQLSWTKRTSIYGMLPACKSEFDLME